MARDGYRIFDSDTHVGPDAAILEPYLSAADKERLARWAPYRATGRSGRVTYTKGERHYRRKLGAAAPDAASAGYMAGFTGVARERQPSPQVDADPAARIADMDYEGVDVNLTLPSGWFGTWTAGEDVALEMAMYRAYHRWMSDYCGAYPERLGGVILGAARDVEGSLAEMLNWGKARWAWGPWVSAPAGTPPAIIKLLNTEIVKALSLPDTRERIVRTGAVPVGDTPEEFDAFIASERTRLGDVISKTGIVLAD